MTHHMAAIDPLELDDTFVGTRVLVTTEDGVTHVGGLSDVLRVEPDGWVALHRGYASTLIRAGRSDAQHLTVAGCLLYVGGKVLVITATSHVLAEATPTDGVS